MNRSLLLRNGFVNDCWPFRDQLRPLCDIPCLELVDWRTHVCVRRGDGIHRVAAGFRSTTLRAGVRAGQAVRRGAEVLG
jgi:hypothetical protein